MIKASINLQDLRQRIYDQAKAELGWKRWSRERIYRTLGLYNDYAIRRYSNPQAQPAR